jgi:hypothetical protein
VHREHDECKVGEDVDNSHAEPERPLLRVSDRPLLRQSLRTHQVKTLGLHADELPWLRAAALKSSDELRDESP